MVTEIIETGRTVDEAIRSACLKLGYDLENCDFEIIDFPKKGFLGLKVIPAKVRVYLKEEVIKANENKVKNERKTEKKAEISHNEIKEKRNTSKSPNYRGVKDKKTLKNRKVEKKIQPKEIFEESTTISEEDISPQMKEKAAAATAYLEEIFKHLSISGATIKQIWDENGVCLSVQGNGLGTVIGRRGETLDALQYLSGLVANRMEGDYLRITVDCGEYRAKRKATLVALARRMSEQVIKTDISKTLEPMNPFERRIIHATVSTIEGVSSTSVGEEPNRRVVITSPTAKNIRRGGKPQSNRYVRGDRQEYRGGRNRDRDNGNRINTRGMRERSKMPATSYETVKEPGLPPSEAADQPLYGKIDLE